MTVANAKKIRLEIKPNEVQNDVTITRVGPQEPVTVVAKADGQVTFLDKVKNYYKALIAFVGFLLILLNELTPVFNYLPGQDKQYVTAAIGVLTTLGVLLKGNEHWVDNL